MHVTPIQECTKRAFLDAHLAHGVHAKQAGRGIFLFCLQILLQLFLLQLYFDS